MDYLGQAIFIQPSSLLARSLTLSLCVTSLDPSDATLQGRCRALLLSLPTMVPHFKELVLSKLPEASCCRLLVSNVDPILRGAQEIGLPSVTFWTTSASSFMAMQHALPENASSPCVKRFA